MFSEAKKIMVFKESKNGVTFGENSAMYFLASGQVYLKKNIKW